MTAFRLKTLIPKEADIQRDLLRMLEMDHRVAFVARFNSGARIDKVGRPIRFNTLAGCPDIMGMLKNGKHIAIEVKRPGWRGPSDDRERAQEEHLRLVNLYGGIGMFAWEVEQVVERLRRQA